jgi:predicted NUDIX family NTP pyrophosphohydrolase
MTSSTSRLDAWAMAQEWQNAKEDERKAIARRREIEDELNAVLAINTNAEGTTKHDLGLCVVKVATRMNHKIDADLVQQIAAEHALEPYLSTLFRWTPEIDQRAWKASPEDVRLALSKAITTTPGRPSYSITPKGE